MSKLTLIGTIKHGEKYTNKDGEEKWKNTELGTLFKDEEKGEYVVKYLGQWCKVWSPRVNEAGYQEAARAVRDTPDMSVHGGFESDDVPFMRFNDFIGG